MAQHDYSLANATGVAFRADLNNALSAIVTNNSGATEPSPTFPYQWWADTSTGMLKQRNAANNAWITVASLTIGMPSALQTQAFTAFTTSGTSPNFTLTPNPAITAYAANQRFRVRFHADGGATNTINVNGLGARGLKQYNSTGAKIETTIAAGQLTDIEYDGTDFVVTNELPKIVTLGSNTASGMSALRNNTTGSNNTASGVQSLFSNTTGNNNTVSGAYALLNNTTGYYNTASGAHSLYSNTTGSNNTASGVQSLFSNTTGNNNTVSGAYALLNNTTGYYNTASGVQALYSNTTGSNNTASGVQSLFSNTTGNNNTVSGVQSLFSNTTGNNNTVSGVQSLFSNTTGNNNTVSGAYALRNNTTGYSNTASGAHSLQFNTTGSNNTAIGMRALVNNTTGSGNFMASPMNSAGAYAPAFDITTQNDRISMGSTSTTHAYIKVNWTVVSDARDKTNFAQIPHGLDFVSKLKPVAYQFRVSRDSEETNGGVRYGFKAQDILELEGPQSVIIDSTNPDKLYYNESSLIPVLVKAIQELKAEIDQLKNQPTHERSSNEHRRN